VTPDADNAVSRYVVVCVGSDPDALATLVRDVEEVCRPVIDVEGFADATRALERIKGFHAPAVRLVMVMADEGLTGMSGVDLLLAVHEKPDDHATRKVLVASQPSVEDLTRLLNRGALHRTLPKPWTGDELGDCIRTLLTSFFVHHAPDDVDRIARALDTGQFPRAHVAAKHQQRVLDVQLTALKRSFLANLEMSDEEVENAMGAAIDEALDDPPRCDHPVGTVLLRQDEPVDKISILVSGQVQLFRKIDDREVVLHTHSAGRIIGLLSLAQRQRAFFTCRALTDVTVLPLTFEQLDAALQASPWLSGYFVTTLIRSLSTRSKRTAQLKVEVENLNLKLRSERDQLADTLDKLKQAQTRLVETEKMATLGQLTAGVAHELNNPTAAMRRAVDFIAEDMVALVAQLADGELITSMIESAMTAAPISTRELRKRGTELASVVDDDALTRRLVKVGITTAEAYRGRFGRLSGAKREKLLVAVERYHELGTALRNLSTCSDRISGIVRSMKSYARSDQELVGDVDVHEGLDDTLRMLDHALRGIDVKRSYGELPRIECHVGEINQVWTNLISNARQALGNTGTLRLATDQPDGEHVRVRIIDSGKGIAPDAIEKVFDLHFTTKGGRVEFGLGMGLPICRQIVARHGGEITAESKPGRTCFTVILPLHYPSGPENEANG